MNLRMRILLIMLLGLASAWNHARADATMESLQTRLQKLGFYRGEVDGVYGSQTAAAIRRYQLAKGLRVTGEPTRETLEHLALVPQQPTTPDGQPAPAPAALKDLLRGSHLERAPTALRQKAVTEAQRQLKILGYYSGPIDGVPNASLAGAIKIWQRNSDLKATGRLDRASLEALQILPSADH